MSPLLQVEGLVKTFPAGGPPWRRRRVHAVSGIDLVVGQGRTLGLVGESGSGKSTLGRCILGLDRPDDGRVLFEGADVAAMSRTARARFRRRVQPVLQDPFGSLDPRWPVGRSVREALDVHRIGSPHERDERVRELFDRVGLSPSLATRLPQHLSGGQRQRVGIAAALTTEPDLIVADEPVSALDVSVQAQVLNLFADLQRDLGVAAVFIAHDLGVVEHVSDDVAVMYLGRVVESGPAGEVLSRPQHPYTRALVEAIPHPDPRRRAQHQPLPGEIPSPVDPPPGCAFHPRCALVREDCRRERPVLTLVSGGSRVACPVVVQHPLLPPDIPPDTAHPTESGRTTCPPQT